MAVYISTASMIQNGSILCPSPIPYLMPAERSLNIDIEFDPLIVTYIKTSAKEYSLRDFSFCETLYMLKYIINFVEQ